MKRITNGKIYNTDTATALFEEEVHRGGNYCGSNWVMVTPRGNLFIYKSSNGQDLYRTAEIHATTPEEIKTWLDGKQITDEEIVSLSKYVTFEEA